MSVEATVCTGRYPFAITKGPSGIGKMSDGTLVFVGAAQFGTYFDVYKSTDQGSTWSSALSTSIPNGDYSAISECLIQDDKLYLVNKGLGSTPNYTFKRVDYSAGSFSVGVSSALVFATPASGSIGDDGCLRKEPGGRLWCVRNFYDGADALIKIQTAYSDDDGATWSFSATLQTSASASLKIPILLALEKNLIVIYPNGTNIQTQSRLHTDTSTSWGSPTNRLSVTSGVAALHGNSDSQSPSKHAFVVANDSSSSGTMAGLQIAESGTSLSYTSIGTTSISSSKTYVSGRANGWRVESFRAADTTHIRVHLVDPTDSAWPSYSDIAITHSFDAPTWSGVIANLLNSKEDGADFTTWTTSGGSITTYSLTYLPDPTTTFGRVVPIQWRTIPSFLRSLPASWYNVPTFIRQIPIAWSGVFAPSRTVAVAWTSSFTYFMRQIPAEWVGQIAISRKIPAEWIGPSSLTSTRSLSAAWTAMQRFQRMLPINWTVFVADDWVVITSPAGDSWAVLPVSPESDVWSLLPPGEGDNWS